MTFAQKQFFSRNFLVFYILALSVFYPFSAKAYQAFFKVLPSKGIYNVGDNIEMDVLLESEQISSNAAQGVLYFSKDILKIDKISEENSIFSLWVKEPDFSNEKGEVNFVGGLPSPGFFGKWGRILTVHFTAVKKGEAKVYFSGKILANDAEGTDIYTQSADNIYTIGADSGQQIEDTDPPRPFDIITVDNEGDPTNPSPLLYFETKDDLSGLDHYEVAIKGEVFKVDIGESLPWRFPKEPAGQYDVLIKALDKKGNFTESKIKIDIETIPVPQISTCPQVYKAGEEFFYLAGLASTNTKVIVSFEQNGQSVKQWEGAADDKGEFYFKKEALLKTGLYEVSAKAEDARGAVSKSSQSCQVKVLLAGIALGPWIVSYKNLAILVWPLLIFLTILFFYLLLKIRKIRNRIRIETFDLKNKFYREYKELAEDIKEQLKEFRTLRNYKPLSEEEKLREEKLLKDLLDVERIISEELKDIEEL